MCGAVGGEAAQRGALRDRLTVGVYLVGRKAPAWKQLRYRVRYTVRQVLRGAVRRIEEATYVGQVSAQDNLQAQQETP